MAEEIAADYALKIEWFGPGETAEDADYVIDYAGGD